jgi:diguanylate cyclase (GGDEF)-like protein
MCPIRQAGWTGIFVTSTRARIGAVLALALLTIFALSWAWKSGLEGKVFRALGWSGEFDLVSQRWRFVIGVVAFSALSLVLPGLILFRVAGAFSEAHEQLARLQGQSHAPARHDAMTGLANGEYFAETISAVVSRDTTPGHCHALLLLDLAGLSNVNEVFGRAVGDDLIRQVSALIRETVHPDAFLARTGGAQFALLAFDLPSAKEVRRLVDLMLSLFGKPIRAGEGEHGIAAAIGVAIYPQDAQDGVELERRASIARYCAKAAGKTAACHFEAHMEVFAQERNRLWRDIRGALAAGQIVPYYQPIVDLETGALVEFEALARWLHPELGVVLPARFIPIAEESALIRELTEAILGSACRSALNWPQHIGLAVNLSPLLLKDGSIVARILAVVAAAGLVPARLAIELTESAVIEDPESARELLSLLRQANIRIALDDFGIGSSSIYHLKRLDLDKLKIDRSYVQTLGSDSKNDAIVRAILKLGHELGITVTAEGIETSEQRHALIAQDCDEGQGYLFGRPMSAMDAETFCAAHAGGPASPGIFPSGI